MKTLDRVLLIILILGVWTLALNPYFGQAHDDDYHSCSGTGTGYGEMDGSDVYVYSLNLDVSCQHN